MLTVHHLGLSQSERIVWLCEELGITYDFKRYERRADNMLAPDEYKALWPMGSAPVITDGDLTLGESGAIVEYIVGKYGANRLTPGPDSPDFAQHLFWFHFANGTFMTAVMMQMVASGMGTEAPTGMIQDRIAKCWNLAERQLGDSAYLGGSELTTADIMMGFPLTTMRAFGGQPIDDMPNVKAYLGRIGEREAYRKAMAKAEPGMEPKLD